MNYAYMEVFIAKIYRWFNKNQRNLPWRATDDPYKIWISEIILQQTRIAQGTNYYLRFIERFPDIVTLAKATENEVLKMWQGLGYYSRARNLLEAAKTIVNTYNGKFPESYDDIIGLKGIGKYTAGAISSIAFNKPMPAVNGNVNRLFLRYFGIFLPINSGKEEREIWKITEELISKTQPGYHNQLLMEFGALQCIS